jgi:hypothetical protein
MFSFWFMKPLDLDYFISYAGSFLIYEQTSAKPSPLPLREFGHGHMQPDPKVFFKARFLMQLFDGAVHP